MQASGIRALRGTETCGVAEHRARLWSSTCCRARSGGFARRVLQGEVCCEPMEADQAIRRGRQPTARWLGRRPIAAMRPDMRASIACGRTCSSRLSTRAPESERAAVWRIVGWQRSAARGNGAAARGSAAFGCQPQPKQGADATQPSCLAVDTLLSYLLPA